MREREREREREKERKRKTKKEIETGNKKQFLSDKHNGMTGSKSVVIE